MVDVFNGWFKKVSSAAPIFPLTNFFSMSWEKFGKIYLQPQSFGVYYRESLWNILVVLCPLLCMKSDFLSQQECIPVGCVPPAHLPSRGRGEGGWCIPLKNWTPPEKLETPRKIGDPPRPDPPCEQNHTRLWKYNLAWTSLRAVIMWGLTMRSQGKRINWLMGARWKCNLWYNGAKRR